jgi:predicted neutral ceramidase superfamily lipid hydrolase
VLKKNFKLNKFHYLNLVLPWFVWIGFTVYDGTGKSLSNVIEAVILGCAVSLWFIFEATYIAVKKSVLSYFPQTTLTLNCLTALLLWALVPGLPE